MTKQTVILMATMAVALSACHGGDPSMQPLDGPDMAEVSLAEAARAVNHSLQNLNQIKRATLPADKKLVSVERYAMPGRTSVDWSGPIAPLLDKLAKMQHYKLVVLGDEPAMPVLATVSAINTPVVDILRNIDLQAGERANLRVDKKRRVLELRYTQA